MTDPSDGDDAADDHELLALMAQNDRLQRDLSKCLGALVEADLLLARSTVGARRVIAAVDRSCAAADRPRDRYLHETVTGAFESPGYEPSFARVDAARAYAGLQLILAHASELADRARDLMGGGPIDVTEDRLWAYFQDPHRGR
jgi:hypothetical protein